jgi:alpha-1,2-glucosyltransferase
MSSTLKQSQSKSLFALTGIGIVMLVIMSSILPMEMIADEFSHLGQIALFRISNYSIIPSLTMPPTYHLLIGEAVKALQIDNFSGIRIVSSILSFMAVILAWTYYKNQKSPFILLQSLQLFFSPLLWPFYWILYTDIPSLVLTLLSLIFFLKQRYTLSAFSCLISLLFRQHNIFWVLLIWFMAMEQTGCIKNLINIFYGSKQSFAKNSISAIYKCTTSSGMYLIPIICFVVFVYINNGIALGDRQAQRFGGIFPLQIFSCLFFLGLLLLPLHLSNSMQILKSLKNHLWLPILIGVLFVIYMKTFKIEHVHNFQSDYFLRNWLLFLLDGHFWYKVAAFGLIAFSFLSLIATPLKSPLYYWLYPVTLLALLPVSLIEQRYYIVPFTLLMLFRKPKGLTTEFILLIWFITLSALITYGMSTMKFFI